MPRARGQASPVDCAPLPPFASPAPAPGPSGCQGATATRCQRCRCRCCRYGPGAAVSRGGARAATAAPAAACATPAAPGRDDAPPAPPNPQRHSRCEAGRLTATNCTDTSRERFPDNSWLHQCVGMWPLTPSSNHAAVIHSAGSSPASQSSRPEIQASIAPAGTPRKRRNSYRSMLPSPADRQRNVQSSELSLS